jgi:hypothetical protein
MSAEQRTLEELEGVEWGEPPFGSHLVTECHRLRRVPLQDLRPEDLRLLIGQQIGVEYLAPLALEVLAADPWTSGDLYDGDLLDAVLKLPDAFWHTHPELRERLGRVVTEAEQAQHSARGGSDFHSTLDVDVNGPGGRTRRG